MLLQKKKCYKETVCFEKENKFENAREPARRIFSGRELKTRLAWVPSHSEINFKIKQNKIKKNRLNYN